jgi:hypothetical protein
MSRLPTEPKSALPGPEMEKTMNQAVSPLDVQKYLQELSSTAKTLNELTDKLTKEVSSVEDAVNRLNLGVEASVEVGSWCDQYGASGLWRLSYGKHAGKWCIFIEYLTEDSNAPPEDGTYEAWFFKDAPRDTRIKAVGKIPDLLAKLVKESQNLAEKISDGLTYAQEIAKSLAPACGADVLRDAVLGALSNQPMLASLLSGGQWKVEGNCLLATVAASKTMIDMAFTPDARRSATAAASSSAGRQMKVQVLPAVFANDQPKARKENQ